MPCVEEFLKKNNYQLKNKEWLLVAQLCPLIKTRKASLEAIEKIYVSSDGLFKLYLKDTNSDEGVSETDADFVQDLIMGNLRVNDGKVHGIRFTPSNFEYVEENLLRQDFKLLSAQKL